VYAYLRWSSHGHTVERYVCEVQGSTRAENLAEAWTVIGERGITDFTRSQHGETPAIPPDSWASSPAVRAVMRGNKGRDTRPERALRSAVHALGLRYRVGVRPLKGVRRTADLVFTRAKVAVFLDGCFWHGCPEHHRPAKKNAEFWQTKINSNRARDAETDLMLTDQGWDVVRIWEHADPASASLQVAEVVRARSAV
jgi:DNA mismatch endonuclease (patch repair protein)